MAPKRDHLTTAGFATGLILLVGAIAFWQAGQSVRGDRDALTGRARVTAAAIADGLALEGAQDLQGRLEALGAADVSTTSITLLVPTTSAGSLRVVADWARDRAPQPAGVQIDAARLPKLVRGLNELSVSDDGDIEAYAPVHSGTGSGVLVVRIDDTALGDARRRAFVSATAIAGIVAIGLAVLAWLLIGGKTERRPAIETTTPAGDASVRRLDQLAKGMHERHYVKQTFGRYVSQRVADVLAVEHAALAAPAEAREVTLFVGEIDAARLAGTAQPEDLLQLVNEWMGAMTEAIDAHGGMVMNQHGDGFIAVFGAPGLQPDHALRAVRAAQTVRRRFADLQRDWEKNGRTRSWAASGKPLTPHFGVHSGRVILGNLGTAMRVRYGGIGADVEFACAVERLANELGADVLVSETALKLLPSGVVATEARGTCGDLQVYALS